MRTDLEERVEKLEQWMNLLPGIIKMGFDEAEAHRELIKARIDRLRTDLGAEIAGVRSEVAQLSSRVDGLETKVDGLETKLGAMDSKIDRVNADVQGLRKDLPGIVGEAVREALGR